MQITHKRSGKQIEVSVTRQLSVHYPRIIYSAFNTNVVFTIKEGRKCLELSSYKFKDKSVVKAVEHFFNVKINTKQNLFIEITDESWSTIKKEEASFEIAKEEMRKDYERRASELPVWYEMYDFLDWGDYTINREREIKVYREALPEDNGNRVVVKTYSFWNEKGMLNAEMAAEWDADFKANNNDIEKSSVKISTELAEKWISNHALVESKKAEEDLKRQEEREAKNKAEEERRRKCFAQAKETGKPVQLYSIFLSGNDIPRSMRDEDSDMGNLVTFAMPDGSTKEEFYHAY